VNPIILIVILAFLAGTAITIARVRGVFVAAMLTGIYSLLSASWMLALDAPDVAFTEAAVGAGISTVLMLSALALTTNREKRPDRIAVIPLMVVLMTGSVLIYVTLDMPLMGDPNAPAQVHIAPEYIDGAHDYHIPNIVTMVLGSYRGYDTMGETAVVFTAGLGVIMILGGARRVMSWQERQQKRREEGELVLEEVYPLPDADEVDPEGEVHPIDDDGGGAT
jgi:multicomponent Na+:H+ antiporter subunit B